MLLLLLQAVAHAGRWHQVDDFSSGVSGFAQLAPLEAPWASASATTTTKNDSQSCTRCAHCAFVSGNYDRSMVSRRFVKKNHFPVIVLSAFIQPSVQ
jgi:hypothetical protein